jgi:peptidoglycan/xylan/chitin deacetylase (PgdA/CDA1 family)
MIRLRISLLFIILILHASADAQNLPKRYIAITFDDLPTVCRCSTDADRMALTNRLMAIYKKFNMPVLAVVNEQKLETNGVNDPAKVALLQTWLDHGYELGNHGYSHKNINEITMAEYQEEILKGERVTRPLAAKINRPYRFFRQPYLSAGDDLKTRQTLDKFLKEHKYIIAPNTITYQDYTFSGSYESALQKGDTQLAQKIREGYLTYTLSQWEAAEKQSVDLFGREVKQILMVHANRLNSDAFGDVAQMMKDRGYAFISIDEALKDPAYARPDTFDGKVGVTWLSRWAAELGKSDIKYDRQRVPQFVLDVPK